LKGAWDWIPHIVRLGASVPTMQSCQTQLPVPARHSAFVWQSCAAPVVDVVAGVHLPPVVETF